MVDIYAGPDEKDVEMTMERQGVPMVRKKDDGQLKDGKKLDCGATEEAGNDMGSGMNGGSRDGGEE